MTEYCAVVLSTDIARGAAPISANQSSNQEKKWRAPNAGVFRIDALRQPIVAAQCE